MAKTFDDKKIIYTMERVGRAYGTKVVLKDISISYYYGAKIGVIGPNGAGKSSLFKILAGIDKDFTGETTLAPGYTIGYLEQEPHLESGKTVLEVVKEGVKEITDLLAEFDKMQIPYTSTNPYLPVQVMIPAITVAIPRMEKNSATLFLALKITLTIT